MPCVCWGALAPAGRSYIGKLGVKVKEKKWPKWREMFHQFKHVQTWLQYTPGGHDLFNSKCAVRLFAQNEKLCLRVQGTHLRVSEGVFVTIMKDLDWILIRALWSQNLWETHTLAAEALCHTWNCNVKRENEKGEWGSNGEEWKEREHRGPTHSVALEGCAQLLTKSTFQTSSSNTSPLMA